MTKQKICSSRLTIVTILLLLLLLPFCHADDENSDINDEEGDNTIDNNTPSDNSNNNSNNNNVLEQKCPLKLPSTPRRRPTVIAHRGASYNLPEHTMPAFRLALELGADALKVDLVPTKDSVLIAMHSVDLTETTDVSTKFPTRKRTSEYFLDDMGQRKEGYFAEDFTLDEIKQLRVKQRLDDGTTRTSHFDLQFEIPTLPEIIHMLYHWNKVVRPTIGAEHFHTLTRPSLQLELWGSMWIQQDTSNQTTGSLGIDVAELLLQELRINKEAQSLFFDDTECSSLKDGEYITPPLVLQSFRIETLQHLQTEFKSDESHFKGMIPPLVYLADEWRWSNDYEMAQLWKDIDKLQPSGIGISKTLLTEDHVRGIGFMEQASQKQRNLAVHPWSQRLELQFTSDKFTNAEEELLYLFCEMGVDGILAENIDLAVSVGEIGCDVEEYMKKTTYWNRGPIMEEMTIDLTHEGSEESSSGVGGSGSEVSSEFITEKEEAMEEVQELHELNNNSTTTTNETTSQQQEQQQENDLCPPTNGAGPEGGVGLAIATVVLGAFLGHFVCYCCYIRPRQKLIMLPQKEFMPTTTSIEMA